MGRNDSKRGKQQGEIQNAPFLRITETPQMCSHSVGGGTRKGTFLMSMANSFMVN